MDKKFNETFYFRWRIFFVVDADYLFNAVETTFKYFLVLKPDVIALFQSFTKTLHEKDLFVVQKATLNFILSIYLCDFFREAF